MFQELEDSFNYGLFQPPLNGRAGKFLDEERRLSEYPFQGNVGHLEVSIPSLSAACLLYCTLGYQVLKAKLGRENLFQSLKTGQVFNVPPGKEGP